MIIGIYTTGAYVSVQMCPYSLEKSTLFVT